MTGVGELGPLGRAPHPPAYPGGGRLLARVAAPGFRGGPARRDGRAAPLGGAVGLGVPGRVSGLWGSGSRGGRGDRRGSRGLEARAGGPGSPYPSLCFAARGRSGVRRAGAASSLASAGRAGYRSGERSPSRSSSASRRGTAGGGGGGGGRGGGGGGGGGVGGGGGGRERRGRGQLHQPAARTGSHVQGVERLHPFEPVGRNEALAERRHPEVDDRQPSEAPQKRQPTPSSAARTLSAPTLTA